MYIPSCTDITDHTMSYSQSKETGMWDTREPAQSILRSMLEAHGDKLKELQQKVEGGSGTLYDLCSLEDNATDVRTHLHVTAINQNVMLLVSLLLFLVAAHCIDTSLQQSGWLYSKNFLN